MSEDTRDILIALIDGLSREYGCSQFDSRVHIDENGIATLKKTIEALAREER